METQSGIHVLGEISLKQANVDTISRYEPDLVLVDLDTRCGDALGFIATFQDELPKSAVLVLSDLADHELTEKALALGAAGVVLKMQPPAVLMAAIRELCPTYRYQSGQKTVARIMEDARTAIVRKPMKISADSQDMRKIESLTSREREIIRLIGLGLKNKDIANRLSISDITVRHHLTSIFCKLQVRDRQNLLILAHHYGLVDLTLRTESA